MPDLVRIGLNYRPDGSAPGTPEKRAEPGDIVSDLPAKSRADLLAPIWSVDGAPPQSAIEEVPEQEPAIATRSSRKKGGE